MEIGASSACFYPTVTEKAFLRIAELGFRNSEIFFNSRCERDPSFIKELCSVRDAFGMNITSLHPYCSFAEGYNFFSAYERRFSDGVETYKRFFDAAAILGAKYIVLHGAKGFQELSDEEYAERFFRLNEVARSLGCTVAHENVVNFTGATPAFMKKMKSLLGDDFKMVLDVKQARRAGVRAEDFIDIMGKSIVHVHLSDFTSEKDCIAPCENGLLDFAELFRKLNGVGYSGKYIIELYADSYKEENEILHSANYLEGILNKVRQG